MFVIEEICEHNYKSRLNNSINVYIQYIHCAPCLLPSTSLNRTYHDLRERAQLLDVQELLVHVAQCELPV